MNEDLNKFLELLDSVKVANSEYEEIELIGSTESLNKLTELGFDLNSIRYKEVNVIDESKIFIIPSKIKPIKMCFDYDE